MKYMKCNRCGIPFAVNARAGETIATCPFMQTTNASWSCINVWGYFVVGKNEELVTDLLGIAVKGSNKQIACPNCGEAVELEIVSDAN